MRLAYYTMASPEFVPGALCLVKSLRRFTRQPVRVLSLDLSPEHLKALEAAGGECQPVPHIGSVQAVSRPWHCSPRFADNCFNKLHLWDSGYDRVVYLDADCLVVKDIDRLFDLDCGFAAGASFALSYDARTGELVQADYSPHRFQAGVLVLRPDRQVFLDLMAKKDVVSCPEDPSDQGFLNAYYRGRWHRLDPVYNATRRVYLSARHRWEAMAGDIRVIHFTLEEPWLAAVPGCEEIEQLWWDCYRA